ncbi:hypothetical protein XK97_16790 [Obesumbacterium proteus]|nr:hypothetical protein XK97_16790 [Obesumbacterium proteus]
MQRPQARMVCSLGRPQQGQTRGFSRQAAEQKLQIPCVGMTSGSWQIQQCALRLNIFLLLR